MTRKRVPQRDPEFAERMFRYYARLYDHYRRQVVSLAILGDDSLGWEPGPFFSDLWGCTLTLAFPVAKLLHYDRAMLEASTNPCASIVLAHLEAQETRHDSAGRAVAKIALVRRLYRLGYDRERILLLYRLIDWFLRLPPKLEDETWLAIRAFEEEQQMTYISTAERFGREHGVLEGTLDALTALLDAKFGSASVELLPELRQITDAALLRRVLVRAATTTTLAEVRASYQDRS